MLLSVIAATIALVVVRQTVLVARAGSVRTSYDAAYQLALSAKTDFERRLSQNPTFYQSVVYRYERPRLCPTSSNAQQAIVPDPQSQSDVPWPASCPAQWNYLPTGQGAIQRNSDGSSSYYDPAQHPIRMQIQPPSPANPLLTITVLAYSGQVETGLTATYRKSSATQLTAYSLNDLRLDSVQSNTGSPGTPVTVSGTVYSGGTMYLPTAPTTFSGAQLFAEGGFVGVLPTTGRFYTTTDHGGVPAGTAPPSSAVGIANDIRAPIPAPLTMTGLEGGYDRLHSAACPTDPTATPAPQTLDGVNYGSFLCLTAGRPQADVDTTKPVTYDTTDGNPLTSANAGPAAYLLMFSGADAAHPTVKVYTASTAPSTTGNCLIQCDLTAMAAADVAANKSPASAPAASRTVPGPTSPLWQPLGEFRMPATGVIYTDADTYIGQCPNFSANAASGGTCSSANTPTTALASVTVVAGSPSNGKDIILNGSMTAAGTSQLGLVATRSVVVPYYARTKGGPLNVNAAIVAYGYGLPRGQSALRTFPSTLPPASVTPGNYGGALNITGSVAASDLSAALPGWSSITLTANPASVVTPPPYFPGFSDQWVTAGTSRLSPFDVCNLANCSAVW